MDRREREAGACTDTPRVRRPGVVNPEGNRQEPLRATPLVRVPRTKAPGATNAMARGWVGVERTRQRKRKKGGEEERIAKYAAGARKRGACLWTVRGKLRVTDQGVGKGAVENRGGCTRCSRRGWPRCGRSKRSSGLVASNKDEEGLDAYHGGSVWYLCVLGGCRKPGTCDDPRGRQRVPRHDKRRCGVAKVWVLQRAGEGASECNTNASAATVMYKT